MSPRGFTQVVAATILAATTAACASPAVGGGVRAQQHPVSRPQGRTVTADRAPGMVPMTRAASKRLPAGVFYILGGHGSGSMNVWEVSKSRRVMELTHNPAGSGIAEMSASPAGIVVGDGLHGGEQDGMLTRSGVKWLRPWHKPHGFIYGFGVRITSSGQLLYLLAPAQGTDPSSKQFTYWLKPSLTGREHEIFRSRLFIGGPLPGPSGRIAIIGPSGQPYPGQSPTIVVISRSGRARRIPPRVKEIGYPPLWGQTAPALVLPQVGGPAQLVFLNGRRIALPDGWQPWSWNPAGTELLMEQGAALGIWSIKHPHRVIRLTHITPGFEIEDVSWLARPANLDHPR